MSSATPQRPKSKRRWLRYSLRSLLLLVTVASCGFGWLGYKMRQAAGQREAVELIEKLGGLVRFEHQVDYDGLARFTNKPPGPVWMRSVLGDDFFQTVEDVYLGFSQVTDDELAQLRCLRSLKSLDISATDVTDKGLIHIRDFTRLEELSLGYSPSGTPITDAGLVHLQGLKRLKDLSLQESGVTGPGLVHLQQLHQLETLNLWGSEITDAGLAYLRTMDRLIRLELQDTKVTDAGLAHLRSLRQLENLDIRRTRVTDAGLEHLHCLLNLRELNIAETLVTEVGIEKLQARLPDLKIIPERKYR